VGVWSGAEAANFKAVLAGFTKLNPGVSVKYTSAGDNTPTVLSTAVAGGNPPDLASISQPGLVKDFASRGALKPIDFVKPVMTKNYAPSWVQLGTIKGHLTAWSSRVPTSRRSTTTSARSRTLASRRRRRGRRC
jgi:alpha-glucoside transport system substrate-binding protein